MTAVADPQSESLTVKLPRAVAETLRRLAAAGVSSQAGASVEQYASELLADAAERRGRVIEVRRRKAELMADHDRRVAGGEISKADIAAEVEAAFEEVHAGQPLHARS